MYETKPYFYGTGRRKNSVARVRVYNGTGKSTINDRDIDDYFGLETLKLIVRQPLAVAGVEGKFDIVVRVAGGGVSGQALCTCCRVSCLSFFKRAPFILFSDWAVCFGFDRFPLLQRLLLQ